MLTHLQKIVIQRFFAGDCTTSEAMSSLNCDDYADLLDLSDHYEKDNVKVPADELAASAAEFAKLFKGEA